MKATESKIKKHRGREAEKISQPCCGTLDYIAECRGTIKKTETGRWQVQPEGVNRVVRKYPAVG